ncbi:MAG: hypothetical protein IJY03_07120 [Prevotella sp.]|nr:hypothetical protein [Prevotella sp.]
MKYYLLFLITLCLAALNGCDNAGNVDIADRLICRCFLFNTSCDNYNYLIEVGKEGILTTYTGTENVHLYDNISTDVNVTNIRNPFLEEVITQDTVMLSSDEQEELKNILECIKDETYVNPLRNSILYDKWIAVLLVGDKQYIFIVTDTDSEGMKLVKYLMRSSKKKIRLLPYSGIPRCTYPYNDGSPVYYNSW